MTNTNDSFSETTHSAPQGWTVFFKARRGGGVGGWWLYEPTGHDGDFWSPGYSTRVDAVEACRAEAGL